MWGCPPNAIITDQDKAMKKAIIEVFPNTRQWAVLAHICPAMAQISHQCPGMA